MDAAGRATTFDGESWTAPARLVAKGTAVETVSCPTASCCAAASSYGDVVIGT